MKKWIKAALIRAIKTMAQAAVSLLGTGAVGILEVDWVQIFSVAALAGLLSILTSIAGLPEVKEQEPVELTEAEALAEIMANPDVMGYEFEEIEDIPDEEAEEEDE